MSTKRTAETDTTPERDADVQGGEAKRQRTDSDVDDDCSSSSATSSSSSTGPDAVPLDIITAEQLEAVLPKTAVVYVTGGGDYAALKFGRSHSEDDMALLWLSRYIRIYVTDYNDNSDDDDDDSDSDSVCCASITYYADDVLDAIKFGYSFMDYDDTKHKNYWGMYSKRVAQVYAAHQLIVSTKLRKAVILLCRTRGVRKE